MLQVAFQHDGTHHIRFCTIHTWFCNIFKDLCLFFDDARFKRFKRLLRLVGNTYVFVSFKRLNLAHIWHKALCDDMLCFCKIYIWFCLFFDDLCLIFDDGRFKWFKRLLLCHFRWSLSHFRRWEVQMVQTTPFVQFSMIFVSFSTMEGSNGSNDSFCMAHWYLNIGFPMLTGTKRMAHWHLNIGFPMLTGTKRMIHWHLNIGFLC